MDKEIDTCKNLLDYHHDLSKNFEELTRQYLDKLSNKDIQGANTCVKDIELCRKRLYSNINTLLETVAVVHLTDFVLYG